MVTKEATITMKHQRYFVLITFIARRILFGFPERPMQALVIISTALYYEPGGPEFKTISLSTSWICNMVVPCSNP